MAVKDTCYLSLRSPTLSIDDAIPARKFLQPWNQTDHPHKPTSILIISAHWETAVPIVNSISGRHDSIYDFYGFPKSMYQLKYPAPGSPHLANRVKQLLTSFASAPRTSTASSGSTTARGSHLDLTLVSNISVCQLSIQTERDTTYHYNMGRALDPLNDENVLIVDTWVKDTLLEGRYEDVNKYVAKAPHAKMAHPWPDHIYPLHVAVEAAGPGAKAWQIHDSWELGALSYASYQFISP
ncbi:extradiol ring-cleavage dioxygenase-like [Pyrus ussuriensis x Pyrus communis]|uniref:Extradiol ring-cleavage dioxygenase-like n=1 Tax=Pyrus ussuriensis x Pyrus communis TaxID=2448454 RepID=A0A5N5I8J2_9ROSA|nr:extradiol ring-cleavage dioxygenase-like [Pyrus ussuriensis x Pyrus communis]